MTNKKYEELSSQDKTNFLNSYLKTFEELSGITKDQNNIKTAIFVTEDSHDLLLRINRKLSGSLNEWIEETFEKPASTFNRNLTLFESEEKPNALFLYWV